MKRFFVTALIVLASTAHAEQDVIGVHLLTYHSPNIYCDNGENPGLYLRDGGTGLTLGMYHNSCKRQTIYVGASTPSYKGASLIALFATGYERTITFIAFPSLAIRVNRLDAVRFSGGSWDRMDVYHVSFERKF